MKRCSPGVDLHGLVVKVRRHGQSPVFLADEAG